MKFFTFGPETSLDDDVFLTSSIDAVFKEIVDLVVLGTIAATFLTGRTKVLTSTSVPLSSSESEFSSRELVFNTTLEHFPSPSNGSRKK